MSSAITAVVVSGALSKRAADKAQHAADAATAQQLAREETSEAQMREDFAPYREAGGRALTRLENLMSGDYDVSQTAGYDFRLQEGYKGIERSQIGRRLSGRAGKEMMRYGQDYASAEYGAEYDRLRSMADIGLSGAAQTATLGAQSTARVSDIYGAQGEFGAEMAAAKGQMYGDTAKELWQAYNRPASYDSSFGSSSYDASRTSPEFR